MIAAAFLSEALETGVIGFGILDGPPMDSTAGANSFISAEA
jgi:hypothetical protein